MADITWQMKKRIDERDGITEESESLTDKRNRQ